MMKKPLLPPPWHDVLFKDTTAFEALEKPEYKEAVSDANQQYYSWTELVHRHKALDPKIIWAAAKMSRRQAHKTVALGKTLSVTFMIPDLVYEQLHFFDKEAAGSFESEYPGIPPELKQSYLVSSLMEEAIASSQIEGAATTRKVAKEMLRTGRSAKTTAERMILNNYNTIRRILDHKGALTPAFIQDLQRSMTEGTLEDPGYGGTFRSTDDVVVADMAGDVAYTPPPAAQIPALIQLLCDFANDPAFIHPIIKGVILHYLIANIHPFYDGNGRTARAVFYWYVLTKGYWLFQYVSISRLILRSRAQYENAYLESEADENDITYFIKYNVRMIALALKALHDYIHKKQHDAAKAVELILMNQRLNMRQAEILRHLHRMPSHFMTIEEAKNTFEISYPTARADLLQLEELGYLLKRKIQGKRFGFVLKH